MSSDSYIVPSRTVAHYLDELHYLGGTGRGWAWSDEFGVLVLAKPTARRLPQDGTWLELVRWCLTGERNGGSRQWARVTRWLRAERPEVTTVVSYSDPSVGHTGALYIGLQLDMGSDLAPPVSAADRKRIMEGRAGAVGEGSVGLLPTARQPA